MSKRPSFGPHCVAIAAAVGCAASSVYAAQPPADAGMVSTLIAVCRLAGEDLPRSTTAWLSDLIKEEAARADSLRTMDGLLDCGDLTDGIELARGSGADKLITGRVAIVADLFVIELSLLSATSGLLEAREVVEVVPSPLDPSSRLIYDGLGRSASLAGESAIGQDK